VTSRDATLLVWGLLAALVIVVQLAAAITKGRLPGFGGLLHRLIVPRIGWVVIVVGWMWLGWHAFAR
jgi:hypothetical protein